MNLFHVIEKKTGKPVHGGKFKYMSKKGFFFLNFINCFEDGNGNLVVDLVAYDSANILEQMYLKKLRQGKFDNADKSAITRYVLPLGIDGNIEGTF